MNIKLDALVKAGSPLEFTVTSPRRLTRVAVFIGRALIHEAQHVEAPYGHTITLGDATGGEMLRITAVDAIGNNAQEWRTIGGAIVSDAPDGAPQLLKASDAVIAWTSPKANVGRKAPPGSVAIGPFSEHGLWVSITVGPEARSMPADETLGVPGSASKSCWIGTASPLSAASIPQSCTAPLWKFKNTKH